MGNEPYDPGHAVNPPGKGTKRGQLADGGAREAVVCHEDRSYDPRTAIYFDRPGNGSLPSKYPAVARYRSYFPLSACPAIYFYTLTPNANSWWLPTPRCCSADYGSAMLKYIALLLLNLT